jgi:hypothetical protein
MQITIRIPDNYGEKMSIIAKKKGVKKSDIARMALTQFIEKNLDEDEETPYEKVKHLIGIADSGIKDLGQNHREYLIKKIKEKS